MQRAEHELWKSTDVARLLALVEAERRYYQDLFRTLPVPVAVVGRELAFGAANRAFRKTFGLEQTDLATVRLPDLAPDPQLESAVTDMLAGREAPQEVTVTLGAGGRARRFVFSLARTPAWPEGTEDEVLLTVSEPPAVPAEDPASAQRAARAIAEEAKRGAVERLAGRVAHVANNLLMIIGGYADELAAGLPESDPRRSDIAEIAKAGERLGRLTGELSRLTRPPSYDVADFPLEPWLAATAARLSPTGAPAGHGAGAELAACTSPALLEQICLEAVRYLKPHLGAAAQIRLEAAEAGAGRVAVKLKVSGAELPAEAVERFFEPFSGAKEGTDPPLGLAGLVRPWEKLEGQLALEAEPGAPLCLTATMPAGAGAKAEPASGLVLLVEDEPGIRGLVARGLERDGWRVLECAAPAEALEHAPALAGPPALLITDLMVPGMPGGELAAELRSRWPRLPVLFISGYTSDAVVADLVANSTLPERTRFLAKPFTIAALVAEVRALVPR